MASLWLSIHTLWNYSKEGGATLACRCIVVPPEASQGEFGIPTKSHPSCYALERRVLFPLFRTDCRLVPELVLAVWPTPVALEAEWFRLLARFPLLDEFRLVITGDSVYGTGTLVRTLALCFTIVATPALISSAKRDNKCPFGSDLPQHFFPVVVGDALITRWCNK